MSYAKKAKMGYYGIAEFKDKDGKRHQKSAGCFRLKREAIKSAQQLEDKYRVKANQYKNKTFKYEVIATPGHTNDSKTFYFADEKIMFTGDFLFYNSIGRMDLPTGSHEEMQKSLEKISKYPLDTKIYPGHFYSEKLGIALEIVKNFFF